MERERGNKLSKMDGNLCEWDGFFEEKEKESASGEEEDGGEHRCESSQAFTRIINSIMNEMVAREGERRRRGRVRS